MTEKRQFCPRGHDTFVFGRDSSYRCLECKRLSAENARAERQAALYEAQEAAHQRWREEMARQREREYRAAIKRGGYDANMARWDKASSELYDSGSRYALCQWEDEGPDGEFLGRTCYRRTIDVYCHVHNHQLERETARKAKEAK